MDFKQSSDLMKNINHCRCVSGITANLHCKTTIQDVFLHVYVNIIEVGISHR